MPDRELTEEEATQFVREHISGDIFHALEAFKKEKTKPTLHDICIIELQALMEGQTQIIIQLGHELNILKERLKIRDTTAMAMDAKICRYEAYRTSHPNLHLSGNDTDPMSFEEWCETKEGQE
jgi:rRNA-processing protein FCF1